MERLTGHHIKFVEQIRRGKKPNFLMKAVYGKEFTNRIYHWAKNLSDDTLVLILRGYYSNKQGYSLDSVCHQGCPYQDECVGNSSLLLRILKEKPLYFPLVLLNSFMNSDNKEVRKRGLKVGEGYRLDEVLKR